MKTANDVFNETEIDSILMKYGLIKFSEINNEEQFKYIQSLRSPYSNHYEYAQFEKDKKKFDKVIFEHLYLNTGFDPIAFITEDLLIVTVHAIGEGGMLDSFLSKSGDARDYDSEIKGFSDEHGNIELEYLMKLIAYWGNPFSEAIPFIFEDMLTEKQKIELMLLVRKSAEYPTWDFDKELKALLIRNHDESEHKPMTLYRGNRDGSTPVEAAMSFTSDYETAFMFATRFGPDPEAVIYEIEAGPEAILYEYDEDDPEHEVLIDWSKIDKDKVKIHD